MQGDYKVKSANSSGVNVFAQGTYSLHQYFGLSLGFEWDFLPISWQGRGPVNPYRTTEARLLQQSPNSYNSSDFLWSATLNLGVFSDVWRDKSSSVRVFANFGLGTNYFFGDGRYEGEVKSCGSSSCAVEYQMFPVAFALPVSFGARFGFLKSHNIELYYKIETQDAEFDFDMSAYGKIKTKISRNATFGARYLYRFSF